MQIRLVFFFIIYFFSSLSAWSQSIRLPAEWEKQEKVHLAWFGNDRRDSVLCRVIEALQPDIQITLNIPSDSLSSSIKSKLNNYKVDTAKINFVEDSYTDFWTRDPLFFVIDNKELKIVDFNYSMYGIFPDILNMPIPESIKKVGEYDKRLAEKLNIPIIKSDFIFEGGGIETNGKGTFLIIKEMALQRNPGKSIVEIEAELKRVLGAKKIIWLKNGLIEDKTFKNYGPYYKNYFGAGANMHIDELCRFVNETTVVFPYIDKKEIHKSPTDSINYYMLKENLKILKKVTTAEGKKLKIYKVPMPEIEQLKYISKIEKEEEPDFKEFGFKTGDTIYRIPACSYLNYFVSNKVVLLQKYWQPGMSESQKLKDEKAKILFQKLFPNRKIIQIYSLSINRGGGGLHCMTHEQPFVEN